MSIPSPQTSESLSSSDSPVDESFLYNLTSDSLSYLLHSDNDLSSQEYPPEQDWSPFTSWLENIPSSQQMDKVSDMDAPSAFNFSMPMELDFDPSMAIDPSSLHFNTSIFTQHQPELTPIFDLNGSLKSEALPCLPEQNPSPLHRRLSVSSSSSSGASFPSLTEHHPTPASSSASDTGSNEDPGTELAQKVLRAAGATLAVPTQPKLPIPRLPRPSHMVSISNKAPIITNLGTEQHHLMNTAPSGPHATSVIGRPKTSHTTIERRYRTNLNARITGLKQSVPALRVLEARLSGKDGVETDDVNERGFVDGVKVGRKMSKANVLGKATEYIKVLKRREIRLKREQDGLKALIEGLINGPALLQAWETQWRETFGGEEKDEVEEDPCSDEEGDGDDGDYDDDGRAKKKVRTVKEGTIKEHDNSAHKPATTTPSILPEKRKRGRPRKILAPVPTPVTVTEPFLASGDYNISTSGGQSPGQKYLLGAFVFVSFFNSSWKTSPPPYTHPHSHTGSVLNHPVSVDMAPGYGVRDFIQIFHMLISILVIFSFVVPWLPNSLKRTPVTSLISMILPPSLATISLSGLSSLRLNSGSDFHTPRSMTVRNAGVDRTALLEALSFTYKDSTTEVRALRKALGISSGIVGLCQGIVKAGKKDRGIELNQLEQRAWVRLGERIALDDGVSIATKLQTYWGMSWHISTFSASSTDLATLALIVRPISSSRATSLWQRAGKQENLRSYEKLVLDTLDVHEATDHLARWHKSHSNGSNGLSVCPPEKSSPLRLLAEIVVLQRIKKHASIMFIKLVDQKLCHSFDSNDSDGFNVHKEDEEGVLMAQTISAGRSLGRSFAELATSLEKVWEMGHYEVDKISPFPFVHNEGDIMNLLSAVVLYRKIFKTSSVHYTGCAEGRPHSIISTPLPSPLPDNGRLHLSLRKVLGSTVFDIPNDDEDSSPLYLAVEDARDTIVDMLLDLRSSGGAVRL